MIRGTAFAIVVHAHTHLKNDAQYTELHFMRNATELGNADAVLLGMCFCTRLATQFRRYIIFALYGWYSVPKIHFATSAWRLATIWR